MTSYFDKIAVNFVVKNCFLLSYILKQVMMALVCVLVIHCTLIYVLTDYTVDDS